MSLTIPSSYKRVFLSERPQTDITPTTFKTEVVSTPQPADGEVLVRVDSVSLDPAMRGWLNDTRSYIPPVKVRAATHIYHQLTDFSGIDWGDHGELPSAIHR